MPVHRVSQGSGVMMLTDAEIERMVALGAEHDVEVNLFLGPRGSWDIGGQAKVSAAVGGAVRGNAAVAASLCDAERAVRLGVRSLLIGDLGVLALLGRMKRDGRMPEDLVLKTSVVMPLSNGPTAALYEEVGATSLNISTDLTSRRSREIRAATTVPIDMYVEVPDDQGGAVRFYDVPEVVRVAAPVYLKLGLRNAPNIYPVGGHIGAMAQNLARERVRRAELVLRLLAELAPQFADDPCLRFRRRLTHPSREEPHAPAVHRCRRRAGHPVRRRPPPRHRRDRRPRRPADRPGHALGPPRRHHG